MTSPDQPQWRPTTLTISAATEAAGFKPEAIAGKAGDVGTKAVEGAGVINGASKYDYLFDPNWEPAPVSQAGNGLSSAEQVGIGQHVQKNVDLVRMYGSTVTGTPPESQYFNVPTIDPAAK